MYVVKHYLYLSFRQVKELIIRKHPSKPMKLLRTCIYYFSFAQQRKLGKQNVCDVFLLILLRIRYIYIYISIIYILFDGELNFFSRPYLLPTSHQVKI
jgi:hypothetical protein